MLKSKFLRRGLVMFLFGTFGLFSCSQNASISSTGNPSDLTGSVEVTLPDMSSSGLAKSALLLDANALNLFITGDDMDTIKYSWPMNSLKGQRVRINGIPTGKYRYFNGFLTDKSGIITHMGKVAASVTAGIIVPVVLKLSATGGVDLCIEIEGYPTSCSGNDSVIVNSCLYVGASGVTNAKISFSAVRSLVRGYIVITDTMTKQYSIEKCSVMKDSMGYKYYDCSGYSKEAGMYVRVELFIKGNTVAMGYMYNASTKETIYKFYSTECTQPPQDTIVLSGKLNAYMYPSGTQDTGAVKFYMVIANGRAYGNLSLYSSDTVLDLNLQGKGSFYPDKYYGEISVSTVNSSGCTYSLYMSFNKSGELMYCKGELRREGKTCGSGSIATIYGNL